MVGQVRGAGGNDDSGQVEGVDLDVLAGLGAWTWTSWPVWGAWMTRPPPRYITTWPGLVPSAPAENSRSPGWIRASGPAGVPAPAEGGAGDVAGRGGGGGGGSRGEAP